MRLGNSQTSLRLLSAFTIFANQRNKPMAKKETINVQGTEITVVSKPDNRNYICITDIARYRNPLEPKDVVKNWMRNRATIEFLGLWERLNNPDFKGVEFDPLWVEAGSNSFTMSPSRWVDTTGAIGIYTKTGSGGGHHQKRDMDAHHARIFGCVGTTIQPCF
jgi:hypothetical protein